MYYELRVGIEEERTDKQIQKASCPPESERQGKNFCYKKGCQLKSKKFCTNWAHRFCISQWRRDLRHHPSHVKV